MNNLRKLTASLALTFAITLTAFAGEVSSPPCASPDPGEVSSPPCSAPQSANDSETQNLTTPTSTETFVADLALDVLQNVLAIF